MDLKAYQDSNGDTSSKRIVGFACFIAMSAVATIAVINGKPGMDALLWPFAVYGGACLGVTVFEKKT